jgi:hypothetical protein
MTMRFSSLKTILAAFIVSLSALPLCAQMYPVAESLDSLVARADQIVIGRIIEVGVATRDPKSDTRQTIVVSVQETLKGDHVQRLPLDLIGNQSMHQFPTKLPSSGSEDRLLFIVRRNQQGSPYVNAINLTVVEFPVVTADLTVISKPSDIEQATKDDVRRFPAKPKAGENFEWSPMHDYDSLKGSYYYGCGIVVPVDERVEKRAHALLSAPNDKIVSTVTTHSMAVHALSFFKSDENIRLLRGLLNDPDESVRAETLRVLKGWGIDVAKPAARE